MQTRKAKPKSSYKIPKPPREKKTDPNTNRVVKSSSIPARKRSSVSSLGPPFNYLYEEDDPHRCLICLDLGTSKIEVAYGVNADNNTDPLKVKISQFQLQLGYSRLPALIGIRPINLTSKTHAELIFGNDVASALQNQSINPDMVWADLKQGRHLIDPDDPAFTDKRAALQETQRRHVRALRLIQTFEEVAVNYTRGSREVFYPKSPRGSGKQRFESVEDIFVVMFRWTLDCVKSAFASASGITDVAEVDRLFGSSKIQIGVGVPDMLPPSSVTRYYGLLLDSGFNPSVHMLSEAKCAAVKVARDRFSDPSKSLKSWTNRDVDVCDIGHGTTDISTIRVAQKGSILQFEFVVDATGNASAGKTIDDSMIDKIRALFSDDEELRTCVPRDFNNIKIEEDVFLEGFRQGISKAKSDFIGKNDNQRVPITYHGPGMFPTREQLVGDYQIHERAFIVPCQMLKECYDAFLKPITQFSYTGLLQQHYLKVASEGHIDQERFFFLVGGGAVPQYTQNRVRDALKKIQIAEHAEVAVPSVRSEAFVAEGGVIMLSDQGLCKRRFHNESLGCVMQHADRSDGVNKIDWFYMIGQRIDDRTDIDEIFHYTIDLLDGEDPDEDESIYPLNFQWRFARTINEKIGQTHFPIAKHPEIRLDQCIEHQMDRELCEFIGWKFVDGTFQLLFNFKLQVRLSGHVVSFKVTIPEGGTFNDDMVQPTRTKTFEKLMTANISHLRDEDRYRHK